MTAAARNRVRGPLAQGTLTMIRSGHPVLIAPATGLVVGLHFLPLARIFGIPLHRWTGVVLTVVATVGFVLVAAGAPTGAVLAAVGLPTAVTLRCTSLLLPRHG